MSNVKPGDLAVIVARGKNNGRIVRVLRLAQLGDLLPGNTKPLKIKGPITWVVESMGSPLHCRTVNLKTGKTVTWLMSMIKFTDDIYLRRLQDTDKPDEMLAIAVPVQFLHQPQPKEIPDVIQA